MEKKQYNVVDIFCGCGGLSYGFEEAGYKVVLGVDFDDAALKSFEMNHKDAKGMKLDLFDLANISYISEYLESHKYSMDVLVGGPPCQGFSLAGPRAKEDKRNRLYEAMVKIAEIFQPKCVVLENVPGLIQLHNGYGAKRIIEDFSNLGYTIVPKILYAPDYGVPQTRRRVFFVGLLKSFWPFEFPRPLLSEKDYITCEQAIGDLPPLENGYGDEVQDYIMAPQSDFQKMIREGSTHLYNHIGSIPSEKTVKFLSMIPEGKNYKALPKEYEGLYKYHEALTRYHSKKPSPTINTCHRSHFHYKWNRIPTVRESARLQTFPDKFIFYGNKAQQYKQVGNAVPPLLAKIIAKQLLFYLNSNNDPSKKI
ncbi:MAG: DNA cytosine methyltransferase [Bacteroidales bacterium]|nr:DNA cytosine methyltransferase [Bacteroidales bacterium]